MDPPFDSEKEIFRWGPIPGCNYYTADWTLAIFERFHEEFSGYAWSDMLGLFRDGRMVYCGELEALDEAGGPVLTDFMLDPEKREGVRKEWFARKDALFELHRDADELTALSDQELVSLLKEHRQALEAFWSVVAIPELANYGSTAYLRKHLADKVPEEEIDHLMEVLTAPTEPSYYQEEEIALAETDDFEAHAQEYFWLQNGYAETRVLDAGFFRERKKRLDKNLREEITGHLQQAVKSKQEAQNEFDLPEETLRIAGAIALGIKWQDHRKKHVLIDLHFKTVFLKELGQRLGRNSEELLCYDPLEIGEALLGKPLPDRGKVFGYSLTHKVEELSTEDAEEFWHLYAEEDLDKHTSEVSGVIASKGKAQAKVRILLDPYNVESFQEGEILIAPMTSPEYVFAMKKAAAIVTDAGGLTSHAAIVSRELKVPCVVGTKVATKIFKDGDEVEVDHGVVRKL